MTKAIHNNKNYDLTNSILDYTTDAVSFGALNKVTSGLGNNDISEGMSNLGSAFPTMGSIMGLNVLTGELRKFKRIKKK